jgi:hypothetical protein
LDLATHGRGGIGPYIGTCIFMAGFGFADAHVQGGMFGEVSFMRAAYVQVCHKNRNQTKNLIFLYMKELGVQFNPFVHKLGN